MNFKDALQIKGEKVGLAFSSEQLEAYSIYCEVLLETNKVMNLTAITDPEEVAVKHMIDSLLVYRTEEFQGKALVDVGTGAGFPGLPLKIYDPSIKLTLIDSLAKRLKFLESVIKRLGLTQVELIHARAEDAGHDPRLREQFQNVIARAVAPLPVLAEYCLPLTKVGGTFYALKGNKYLEEASEGASAIKLLGGRQVELREVTLPELKDKRAIIVIKKIKPTAKIYPRKAGSITKNPLL